MLFYSLGLQILGVASIAGSVNLVVTALNLRAPGMTLMRMPVFAWMTLITSTLTLFAMPINGVAHLAEAATGTTAPGPTG